MEDAGTVPPHHPFGFPFQPYPIQVQLMEAIVESAEQSKIAILESPTGTGKSLSTICASLSWLEAEERRREEELERGICELKLDIEESAKERDWLNVHKRKMEAEQRLEELREEQAKLRKIGEKLERAREGQRRGKWSATRGVGGGKKRRILDGDEAGEEEGEAEGGKALEGKAQGGKALEGEAGEGEDNDLMPSGDWEEGVEEWQKLAHSPKFEDEQAEGAEAEQPKCLKIIYASRTHSQLEQFLGELARTRFRPRVLTLGSRQLLCVNDAVRGLGQAGLVNDRCNELLAGKGGTGAEGKRTKMESGQPAEGKAKKKNCSCTFAHSTAIEDLSEAILTSPQVQSIPELVTLGHQRHGCPYFASKSALGLCQLILVPYNILLHAGTRRAWDLDLRGNVVLVDEAHNLLQTLASIHSVELNCSQLEACCQCIHDYLDRFRTRLGPGNLRNIRQLHAFALALQRLLNYFATNSTEVVLSLAELMIQLGDSMNIDLYRLLSYLDESKLCRKLRDFRMRYQGQGLKAKENRRPPPAPSKGGSSSSTHSSSSTPSSSSSSSTPLYQLREFLEALTTRAEDARIVVDRPSGQPKSLHRLRFILLNPAEKLRSIVDECRSLVLLGGTMRPVEQLRDALIRVCGVPEQRVVEFACGHVVDPRQLVALSLGKGPDQTLLNFQFGSRESLPVLRSLAQTLANLLRHIPNGSVAFFPSYSFLGTFVQSIHASGHFGQLQKLKSVFVERRAGEEAGGGGGEAEPEDVWKAFCQAARTQKGALLMAVVGGKLSEGMNFSDELGRCVLMIGLPYPNRQSAELQERMKFVDQKMGSGAGQRLYEQLCLQSLNQAIGRAIRHRRDYAAILLLDQRFGRPNLERGLPGWIRERLSHAQTFPEALVALIAFYRSHKDREDGADRRNDQKTGSNEQKTGSKERNTGSNEEDQQQGSMPSFPRPPITD